MPNPTLSVLFRYRDLIANTLEQHRTLIANHGACWWGWWKKPYEDYRQEVWEHLLEEINQNGHIIIGLFNSGAKQHLSVFHARVVAVKAPEEEGTIKLNEEERLLVPGYYRKSPYSLGWLKLDQIATEPTDFFKNYSYLKAPPLPWIEKHHLHLLDDKVIHDHGELSAMDTTIWQIRPRHDEDRDERLVFPGLVINEPLSSQPIPLKGETILHLSDLHFSLGEKLRAQHVWGYSNETQGKTTLVEAVEAGIQGHRIGLVIISGDITFLGNEAEFEIAYQEIRTLLNMLSLGPEHLVIIPGNHNIQWSNQTTYHHDAPVNHPPPKARAAYEQCYRRILKHDPHETLTMTRRFVFPNGQVLEVGAVNSSSLEHGKDFLSGMGRVHPRAFAAINQSLHWQQQRNSLALRWLVVHHHVCPTESIESPNEYGKGFGMAVDAAATLRKSAAAGVHLVLHGHRHQPFIWRTAVFGSPETDPGDCLGEVAVLGGGSAGSRAVNDQQLNFHLIRPRTVQLSVSLFRSRRMQEPFKEVHQWCAPLSIKDGHLVLGNWRSVPKQEN
ncbi:metallophosphoesterase family protein [Acanthopleuribacter pedis]|uniref:Metallophosphoesterase n=1 Tax=Acanthopleuribacter pedis TaxID=442870 RepID=A0A8J7QD36_9BACT|nr:metallophosphoesterase [Acanthopleuribacter pedis]MBO1321574.1 metallophosphoesterase [Acanthopleuribacter pedis]